MGSDCATVGGTSLDAPRSERQSSVMPSLADSAIHCAESVSQVLRESASVATGALGMPKNC